MRSFSRINVSLKNCEPRLHLLQVCSQKRELSGLQRVQANYRFCLSKLMNTICIFKRPCQTLKQADSIYEAGEIVTFIYLH